MCGIQDADIIESGGTSDSKLVAFYLVAFLMAAF